MSQSEFRDTFQAIKLLLEKGAVSECEPAEGQFLSRYFIVPKSNKENRFILNLKELNCFIDPPHFKMEDSRNVLRLLMRDGYMATVDLKDAFLLVPIADECKKYLRFQFNNVLYECNCLPFGLCTSPYVFTKLLKPVAHFLRSRGLISVIYLDDIWMISNTEEACNSNVLETKDILEKLGFLLNFEKCKLIPSQECKFLGMIYNSKTYLVELPSDKRQRIFKLVNEFLLKSECKIREFAQCIGILVSACPAVKYGWLYTKSMEREKYLAILKTEGDYDRIMSITATVKLELNWWRKNILSINNPIREYKYQLEIFSDASLTGWGACCDEKKTHGWWNLEEKIQHINYLELKAVYYALRCYASNQRSCEILLRVDNTTAISYINRMGGLQYQNLTQISRLIWEWCAERDIWIFASYIKSKENVIADSESRVLSPETEWELNSTAFTKIIGKFGQFDIDLFASNINAKCEKFVSWYADPKSYAIDALTISWSCYFFYAFPPFSLILRCLRKIVTDEATGVLIVPLWPTQTWYPVFTGMLIEKPIIFHPQVDLLKSPFREEHPLYRTLTLVAGKLSGKRSNEKACQKKRFQL